MYNINVKSNNANGLTAELLARLNGYNDFTLTVH